jgi:hypothetical protein
MDSDIYANQEITPAFVRDQLDEILAHEITALLEVDSSFAMLSFNLSTIACITLIIEREREIKEFPDFPPERFTKETFISELQDIGIEKDTLTETVNAVLNKGYILADSKGELKAQMPAFMMVGFLDSMFPGMQGMNLVAFVLQMNDEVTSERKSIELATASFKATLKSRGTSVSKDKAEKKVSEMVSGTVATTKQSKEVSQKLKKGNLDRLSKVIRSRKKRSADTQGQLNIKDISAGPDKEALEAEKEELRKIEEAANEAARLAMELAEKEERIKEAEEVAKEAAKQLQEIEEREKKLLEAQEEARKASEKAALFAEKEAQMAKREAELKVLEEKLKQDEEQKQVEEEEAKQKQVEEE